MIVWKGEDFVNLKKAMFSLFFHFFVLKQDCASVSTEQIKQPELFPISG